MDAGDAFSPFSRVFHNEPRRHTMFTSTSLSVLLGTALFDVTLGAALGRIAGRDGSTPSLTFDPNTTSWCTWWTDLNTPVACSTLLSQYSINEEQFRRWVSLTKCYRKYQGYSYGAVVRY